VTGRVRKLALTVHVTSAIGWLGAVVAFLVLALAGLGRDDAAVARGIYVAMDLVTWWAIVPLCAATLLTGVIQSLGTPWGLMRHYWVVVKLVLTVVATIVLALRLSDVSVLADRATQADLSAGELLDERRTLVLHAAGGIIVLLATTAIAVFKPPGRTRYGWRTLKGERAGSSATTELGLPRSTDST
jgi:hypothetical protein